MKVHLFGSGEMALQITVAARLHGMDTVVHCRSELSRQRALESFRARVEKVAARQQIAADKLTAAGSSSFQLADPYAAACDADLVIEAIVEDAAIKRGFYEKLALECEDTHCVIASNTSSIPISELARGLPIASRMVGLHLFNPVHAMQLVEIVRGGETLQPALSAAWQFAERLGKTPVVVDDGAGFVVNRVLMAMINEAAELFGEYDTDAATVDLCMKLGCNHPMGPLALADHIGLDVVESILLSLNQRLGSSKYWPAPALRRNVMCGRLGKKSGRGFYDYQRSNAPQPTTSGQTRCETLHYCNHD